MNNQVFSNKAITVIVILALGGIIFFTDSALKSETLFVLPENDILIEDIKEIFSFLSILSPESESTTPPKQPEVPTFEEDEKEFGEMLEKQIEEIKEEPTTPPKTINLNELTELNDSIAPPFKTFKEEVTWYAQFSDIHNLEEIPQGCDPVIRLYKQTSELDNKSYLAGIILEICDLG